MRSYCRSLTSSHFGIGVETDRCARDEMEGETIEGDACEAADKEDRRGEEDCSGEEYC
jgi:hypothetical protein